MSEINISERQLEEFVVQSAKERLGLRIVGRQIKLPSGVLDLLAYEASQKRFYVIELKKGDLKSEHFAQVSAYCNDLAHIYSGREFYPFLIGGSVQVGYLNHFLRWWGAENPILSRNQCYYRLYGFHGLHGLGFEYSCETTEGLQELKDYALDDSEMRRFHFGVKRGRK